MTTAAYLQRWATAPPAAPDGHFRCEMCGEVFPVEDGDDDAARAEAESKGIDPDDSGLVCDACYATTPWGRSDFRPPGFAARSRRRVDGVWVTVKAY